MNVNVSNIGIHIKLVEMNLIIYLNIHLIYGMKVKYIKKMKKLKGINNLILNIRVVLELFR